MKKKCNRCQEVKSISEFGPRACELDGVYRYCRVCQRQTSRNWYKRNRERVIKLSLKRNKVRFDAIRLKIWDYLLEHPCVDCGEGDPIVLQFDHVRGEKEFMIGTFNTTTYVWEVVLKEIQKCDVRCANCHMRRHFNNRRRSSNG